MKSYWQIFIKKDLSHDWTGTIFISKLYHSKEACLEGCRTKEFQEIGEILEQYDEINPHGVTIDGVLEWLTEENANEYFVAGTDPDYDITIFWEWVNPEVAED